MQHNHQLLEYNYMRSILEKLLIHCLLLSPHYNMWVRHNDNHVIPKRHNSINNARQEK